MQGRSRSLTDATLISAQFFHTTFFIHAILAFVSRCHLVIYFKCLLLKTPLLKAVFPS